MVVSFARQHTPTQFLLASLFILILIPAFPARTIAEDKVTTQEDSLCQSSISSVEVKTKVHLHLSVGPVYQQLTEKILFGQFHAGVGGSLFLGADFHHGNHVHNVLVKAYYGEILNQDNLPALNFGFGLHYGYGY